MRLSSGCSARPSGAGPVTIAWKRRPLWSTSTMSPVWIPQAAYASQPPRYEPGIGYHDVPAVALSIRPSRCRRMPGSLTLANPTSLRTWQRQALDRLADWQGRTFPDLSGAGCRQDATGARARQAAARAPDGQPCGGPVPHDAADTPMGERRCRARRATTARRAGAASAGATSTQGRGGHLCARGERPARVGGEGGAGHAGVSSTRGGTTSARISPGARASNGRLRPRHGGCCCRVRHFARTPRRSRACAMTPSGWPSPTCPTPTPRRSPTGSVAQ